MNGDDNDLRLAEELAILNFGNGVVRWRILRSGISARPIIVAERKDDPLTHGRPSQWREFAVYRMDRVEHPVRALSTSTKPKPEKEANDE